MEKIGAPAVNRTRARGLGNRCSIQLSYEGARLSREGNRSEVLYHNTPRNVTARAGPEWLGLVLNPPLVGKAGGATREI